MGDKTLEEITNNILDEGDIETHFRFYNDGIPAAKVERDEYEMDKFVDKIELYTHAKHYDDGIEEAQYNPADEEYEKIFEDSWDRRW